MKQAPGLLERPVRRAESWRPVLRWEGLYEDSDLGRVRSLDRIVVDSIGRVMHRRGKVLRQSPNGSGHMRVKLYRGDGEPVTRFVHHLVLESFDRPCPPGMECRHGPGGPGDNRWPEAIRWGTREDNQGPDRVRDGTDSRGERCGNAKLTEVLVRECRARYAAGGITERALCVEYDVTVGTMHKALTGTTWRHVTLRVRFAT